MENILGMFRLECRCRGNPVIAAVVVRTTGESDVYCPNKQINESCWPCPYEFWYGGETPIEIESKYEGDFDGAVIVDCPYSVKGQVLVLHNSIGDCVTRCPHKYQVEEKGESHCETDCEAEDLPCPYEVGRYKETLEKSETRNKTLNQMPS